jgi:hypothetical protein
MTESCITDKNIEELDSFNAWLKKEIINKEIFTCNHQVDRKNNTILINKGKMTLTFNMSYISLDAGDKSKFISFGMDLMPILMDGLQYSIKEHFIKTYQT